MSELGIYNIHYVPFVGSFSSAQKHLEHMELGREWYRELSSVFRHECDLQNAPDES